MEPHSEILQELQSLNSPLAHASRAMPFTLPAGYFAHAAEQFVAGVLAQDVPDISLSVSPSKRPVGELPAGYFETAAHIFVAGVLAGDAPEVSLSVAPSKELAGEIPAGYFEYSAEQFVAGVLAQDTPDISLSVSPSERTAGELPAHFFEQFPAQVLQLAKAHDLVESLPRPAETAAPAGYFEGLPAQVMRRVQAEDRPTVLPAVKPRKTVALPLFRWAAAAALIVGIGFGMHRAGEPQAGPQAVNRALATIPQAELQAYVTQNLDDFDIEMLEKGANLSTMKPEAPHLRATEIQSFLQAEGLL